MGSKRRMVFHQGDSFLRRRAVGVRRCRRFELGATDRRAGTGAAGRRLQLRVNRAVPPHGSRSCEELGAVGKKSVRRRLIKQVAAK